MVLFLDLGSVSDERAAFQPSAAIEPFAVANPRLQAMRDSAPQIVRMSDAIDYANRWTAGADNWAQV
jgi:hypothetical protein